MTEELLEFINEIFVAVYQLSPPSIQSDLEDAVDKYSQDSGFVTKETTNEK